MNTNELLDEKKATAKPLVKHLARLYELEAQIHRLDPWQWLTPADIFCVHREGYDPLFVCFNRIGEFKTVDIGLGWKMYPTLLHVHAQKAKYPAFYFEARMFQFGRLPADGLFPAEVENHAKHGPAEKDALVPYFRSHGVGRAPWPVNRAEALFLADVMYIIFGTAMRLEDFREPIGDRAMREVYTVPVAADGKPGEPFWKPVPNIPNEIHADTRLPGELLKRVHSLPVGTRPMEIEHIFLPCVPGDKISPTKPPSTGYLFLLATGRNETQAEIAAFTLQAGDDLKNVWGNLPKHLLDIFAMQGVLPPEIQVTDSRLLSVLRPLTEHFPFKLTRTETLPIIANESAVIIEKLGLRLK